MAKHPISIYYLGMYQAYLKGIPPNIYKQQSSKDMQIIEEISHAFDIRTQQVQQQEEMRRNYKFK